jgi:hypothetical protein
MQKNNFVGVKFFFYMYMLVSDDCVEIFMEKTWILWHVENDKLSAKNCCLFRAPNFLFFFTGKTYIFLFYMTILHKHEPY